MRATVWLATFIAALLTSPGFAAEGDAELVVLPARAETVAKPPQRNTETFSSLSNGPQIVNDSRRAPSAPALIYEYKQPGQPIGQAAGFRVEINAACQIKISVSFATAAGKHSDWAQMLDQPADRAAVDELVKWMLKKKLDSFDARTASEKCAEAGKATFAPTAPNEFLSVQFPNCAEPKLIYWRDLPNEARLFPNVAEVQTLNAACSEIALLATSACPQKSVLRGFLKRE